MQLNGRNALITGAGSGIGRAMAVLAVERGMNVALVGRTETALQGTVDQLRDPNLGHVLVGDITDKADRQRLREETGRLFGHLDLLINNAGVQVVGPIDQLGNDDMEKIVNTNLLAPMAIVRDMLDLLKAASPSQIVNVGSMFGQIGFPLFSVYSASKFGLRGFSDALRRELKDARIGVTYAAPRATATAAMEGSQHLAEPFGMTIDQPEMIARRILNGVERDANVIFPGGMERVFVAVQGIFPSLIDRSIVSQLRKAIS